MGFFRGVLSAAIVVRKTNNKFSERMPPRGKVEVILLRRSDLRVKSEALETICERVNKPVLLISATDN